MAGGGMTLGASQGISLRAPSPAGHRELAGREAPIHSSRPPV